MTEWGVSNEEEGCPGNSTCKLPLGLMSRLAGVGVIAIAVAALSGWFFDIPELHSILPGLPPMVPDTAAGLVLAGLSLVLLQPPEISVGRRRTGLVLALFCLLIGLINSLEYLRFIPAVGLEQLLLPIFTANVYVLQQSPHSALAFTFTGLALLLFGLNRKELITPAQWLAVLILATAIVVLYGYIYGLTVFYSYTTAIGMALPASVSFIILANGILLARPTEGVMGFITSHSAGGVLMRRLLPSVIIVMLLINWGLMASEKAWNISEDFEHAMHAVLTTLLVTALIVQIALSLNREERLRRSAEAGSRQYQADLAHLVRLGTMGEMVASIAHELKQPLTAINLYAANSQALLESKQLQPEELTKFLKEIQNQSIRAAEIIRRTREFARKQEPQVSDVQLNTLITEVRDFLSAEAKEHGIQLHMSLDPLIPATRADELQLKQVVLNIVHNAIECLQTNITGTKQVMVRTRLTDTDEIRVDISDTGPGMDIETLSRIFESFFTTKGDVGMGMGLSISRSIIEAHGGQLWATSTPGEGATFSFTLPAGSGARG